MKKNIYLYLLLLSCFFFSFSCKKKENPINSYAKLRIHFIHKSNDSIIQPDQVIYSNFAGNAYSVSMLKYYVSNLRMETQAGDSSRVGGIWLVDARRPDMVTYEIDSIPRDKVFDRLSFMLGVPYERNHTGAQDGYLDPAYGMIWTWSTGYIFLKHEGKFKDNQGKNQQFMMHLGTNRARHWITLNTPLWKADEDIENVYIHLDVKKLYGPGRTLDFNQGALYMSDPGEEEWIDDMVFNLKSAFNISTTP